jgi:hypothetical protein
MPGVVASAGDYTVELDTGFLQDAFILDTSLLNGTDVRRHYFVCRYYGFCYGRKLQTWTLDTV